MSTFLKGGCNMNDETNKLREISWKISSLKNEVVGVQNSIKSLKKTILYGGAIVLGSIVSIAYKAEKFDYEKAIIFNDDNAIIIDRDDFNTIDASKSNIIYVDEDKGLSANDIAVSLVGEEGTIYYYDSKEKTLVNEPSK